MNLKSTLNLKNLSIINEVQQGLLNSALTHTQTFEDRKVQLDAATETAKTTPNAANQQAVEGLEKILGVKLKENEVEQLHRVESLNSVFARFQELSIEPPMSYEEAEKTPSSLLTLMCYLTAKEAINRATIS